MKLTEKEKTILELALIQYKEECYTRWHAGERDTAEWQEEALMIESIRRKMYKSKTMSTDEILDSAHNDLKNKLHDIL